MGTGAKLETETDVGLARAAVLDDSPTEARDGEVVTGGTDMVTGKLVEW